MIAAAVGVAGAALGLLTLLLWLPTPRPALWALGGAAVVTGTAAAVMAPQRGLWPLLALTLTAAAVAWHDGLTQLIPDTLTAVTIAVVIIAAAIAGGPVGTWIQAALAAAALAAGYLLWALTGTLGLGDVKYALPLGFAFGWHSWAMVWQATMLGLLIGVAAGLVMLLRGHDRKAHMPFGPALASGAVLAGVLSALLAR